MPARRVLVIVNPKAGRRDGPALAARWAETRRSRGDSCEVRETAGALHAIDLARESTADAIVVIGGDGTLREVAAGLGRRRADVPVVFVPKGHGNVIAREFDIPLDDPESALTAVDSLRETRLDVFVANGHPFLAMVGVGFDALATRFVDLARHTRLGRAIYDAPAGGDLLYGIGGVVGLLRLVPTRFSCSIDGVPFIERVPTITVCNTRTYAKSWAIATEARADDECLDVVAQRFCFAPFQLVALLRARRREPMGDFLAATSRGRRVSIRASRPFRWQLDGDPMENVSGLEIELESPPLRLLLPLEPAAG